MLPKLSRKTPAKLQAKQAPRGFKVVAAPKSKARRELVSAEDIATSGGCRTVRRQDIR